MVRMAGIIAPSRCEYQWRGARSCQSECSARFWCTNAVTPPRAVYSRALWGLQKSKRMKIGRAPRTFQELIFTLQRYWSENGCVILEPYDMEVGAGTFHTATFLSAVGPEPWRAAYV